MKLIKLEKVLVNSMAKRNILTVEKLFSQIDLNNIEEILEVGCGIGTLTSYLAEKYNWKVTGIDLDPEQIERAKKDNNANENLTFLEADVTKLPFENNGFDMALSCDVLHHIPNWYEALNEIRRILSPKAFYILNDLALPRFTAKIFKNCGVYAVKDITNHLKRNNFKVIDEMNKFGGRFSIVSQKKLN